MTKLTKLAPFGEPLSPQAVRELDMWFHSSSTIVVPSRHFVTSAQYTALSAVVASVPQMPVRVEIGNQHNTAFEDPEATAVLSESTEYLGIEEGAAAQSGTTGYIKVFHQDTRSLLVPFYVALTESFGSAVSSLSELVLLTGTPVAMERRALPASLKKLTMRRYATGRSTANAVLSLANYAAALERVTELEQLTLDLEDTRIIVPPRFFDDIGRETLNMLLIESDVTFESSEALANLESLERLALRGSNVTVNDLAALRKAQTPLLALQPPLRSAITLTNVQTSQPPEMLLGPEYTWHNWVALRNISSTGYAFQALESGKEARVLEYLLEHRKVPRISMSHYAYKLAEKRVESARYMAPKVATALTRLGVSAATSAAVLKQMHNLSLAPAHHLEQLIKL
jgi:hypothetical protein